jgi:DNA gyrase subunit A
MIRTPISDIGIYGRNTQGVRLINLTEDAKVNRITLVDHEEQIEDE